MLKVGIKNHEVRSIAYASFEMTSKLNKAIQSTVEPMLKGELRQDILLNDNVKKAEHVAQINQLNLSLNELNLGVILPGSPFYITGTGFLNGASYEVSIIHNSQTLHSGPVATKLNVELKFP